MRLLAEYGVELSGKSCVIVGRSNIVGKPLAMLMLRENATVTICHTKTEYLKKECSRADILISAAGQAGLITGDMVKEGGRGGGCGSEPPGGRDPVRRRGI